MSLCSYSAVIFFLQCIHYTLHVLFCAIDSLGTVLVGTHVPITDGAHSMRHISPIARFGGIVYGTANKESYSFQIGMRLAPINQVLHPFCEA